MTFAIEVTFGVVSKFSMYIYINQYVRGEHLGKGIFKGLSETHSTHFKGDMLGHSLTM